MDPYLTGLPSLSVFSVARSSLTAASLACAVDASK